MKQKKLNCIRGTLRRRLPGLGGLLALVLATLLLASPALAAGDNAIVPRASLANKPEVTIQGNVVVDDNGVPTGFYELALCVRSPKRIVDLNGVTDDLAAPGTPVAPGTEISESAYNAYVAANPGTESGFAVTYYPFAAASAVVEINADVLTAVNWDVETVTYGEWDDATRAYTDAGLDAAYPRGIDLTPTTGGNFDPDVWSATDPEPFPDITTATLSGIHRVPVALDAEGDRSAFTVAAQVDDYAETATAKTALVTLSAHAPDNKPVIYTKTTPVAVVRFSYDLARFPKGTVMVNSAVGDVRNRVTGTAANEGFWLGLDRGNNTTVNSGKTPLTWLADTALGTGGNSYDYSDGRNAATEAGQAVWTKLSSKDTSGVSVADWTDTEYYYYLGGENPSGSGAEGTVPVSTPGGLQNVEHVWVPNTASRIKVLAEGTDENPMPGAGDTWTQAQYSYYTNLITLNNAGVRLELVNAPTFRKPTGGKGGTQILFYDWDDRLIGALIVGKGDVRSDVNSYVERNFIAPDLRASQYLDNGEVPTDPTDLADYENVVNSLDREFTYRGSQYPYRLNGGDALKDAKGDNYPLTNKLDYVFYKRLNLVNTLRTPDAADPTNADKDTVENYYTVAPVSSDTETGKYPYVYGWAIVEDPANKKIETAGENWAVKLDSVKTEDTWTTFNSGELRNLRPNYTASGYPTQAIPAGTVETQPGGMSSPLPHASSYDYMTSSAGANGYLRFADFSDMEAMLKDGQDVLIVKAVYEPGVELQDTANYTSVEGSLYTIRYSTDASEKNAVYSVQYQYQRANNVNGDWQGVRRIREPAVETGYVYDINEFDDPALGIDQDLNNNRAFSMKTLAVNSDIMDIDILSGGVIWRIDYVLRDLYGGKNVATGETRSANGILDLKTGFNYEKPDGSGNEWTYDERQGTDSLVVDATIAHILTEATKIARGESTDSLTNYFSLDTVHDLNLRSDMQGTEFSRDYADCATYTQNLVNAIVAAYPDPDTAPAGLYDKRGAVTLTWHQLQRHIIMAKGGNAAGIFAGGTLMADGAAAGFPWCRYDQCSADVKLEINGLGDLLQAVHYIQSLPSTDKDYKRAEEALKALTGAQLQGYGFRYHSDGVPYDTSAGDTALKNAILDDLKDAVDILAPTLGTTPDWSTVTWTKAQEAIIQGNMGTATPPAMDLWWQPSDGKPSGTPPTIDSWEKLWKYSIHDTLGVDVDGNGTPDALVPDAFDSFDQTALDALVSEGPGTSTATNVGWFRTGTVTTVGGEETAEKFTAAGFTTAWAKALQALTTAPAPYTAATVSNATWEEIQYALINGTYKSHADIINDSSIDYWWKNGGSPKLTFAKLLVAVNDYTFNGNATKLDDILKNGIGPINNDVYLRADDGGTEFETASQFKSAVNTAVMNFLTYTSNSSDFLDSNGDLDATKVDEYVLQYILIHSQDFKDGTITTVPDKAAIQADTVNNDYWWFAGGKPTKPMPLNSVKDLFKAYLWYKGDTSTGVGGQNAQALGNLDAAKLSALGIRSDGWGVPYAATATNAQLIAALDSALGKLPYNMSAIGSVVEADLALELQYLLANPAAAHQSASVLRSSGTTYWWQEGDKSYPVPTNQQEVLEAVWKAHIGNAAGDTVSEAETALKALDIDFITNRKGGMAMRKDLDGKAFASANAFYTALTAAADAMQTGGQSYTDLGNITQRQLQWMLLGNPYDTHDNVENATIDKTDPAKPVDDYWWFTSDTKPSEEPGVTEKPLDESKVSWNDLMNAAAEYAVGWDSTKMDAIFPANDESLLNDSFLLRKSLDKTDTFGSVSEFYDQSWSELLYNVTSLFFMVDRYADFSTDGVTFDVRVPTWAEFQYVIIHYDEIVAAGNALPSLDDIQAEAEDKYDWRYTKTEPTPPEPEKEEKPLVETNATWSDFISAAWEYAQNWDNGPIDNILGVYDESLLNDDFLLRQSLDETDVFTSTGDLYDCSWGDKLYNVTAMFFMVDRYADFSTDGFSFDVRIPTWAEFQYMLIHYDEIVAAGNAFPTLEDIQAEAEEKYTWRYTTPAPPTPPEPPKTEKSIDESRVAWSDFISAAWDYAQNWDDTAMNGLFPTYDQTLLNDDYLLRKNLDGDTFGDVSEFYDDSWGDMLYNTFTMFFMVDRYGDFSSDGFTFDIAIPTWYEFQYVILHYDEIVAAGNALPDLDTIKAECEAKWDWKYTTS